ncbi:hypothetical protein VOLCADRAFT_79128 [Volvox carteri f. nagariensis]|uniref:Protein ROOT HAIR DEFECTIVE 3 homolog n=1 Tax=Volvox carteri f. nagariensis TaxID=3068 RepID=D8TJA9_VOLCA|nr:uncharacterized protein VOLCADRAFT_79128 [Volvox carteri f. nagariensis]EFJ52341.1 hypothetical protein VOLCADRAFT_79128 [Volvox carteri f. nagariensis]|eukprot:XP_002946414.1 hypothetical protein VOLCADRAFT_79128 [Volvox carteri f. nagariensis]
MADIVQVINGEGQFEEASVQQFVEANDLAACKTNYQVVAIMGPQSSGKSTLLNYVFGTNFTMMDAMAGRGQTTKGIWMSKSPKVTETTVLVMDLEGSDGRERGEDDTNFERQSALFALSVADVLLVNIWCHDIGREHGSGKPLLKTIFQVNLKLFAPEPDRKRSVLLFVIRDKTRTPLPKLVEVLEADLDRMWDAIAKPQKYEGSKLTDFFEVQYAALSHFEERYEDFQADAVHLRRRFSPDGEESLIRGDEKLPGDAFALSIRNIWDVIRAQKDLNLPAHKVMVANIRCQEILEDQLKAFAEDQAWTMLQEASSCCVVEGFGRRAHSLIDSCVVGYQAEARYFDTHVREAKLAELQQRLLAALQPVYQSQVAAQQAAVLAAFDKDLKLAVVEGGGRRGSFMAAAAACRTEAVQTFDTAFVQHLQIEGTPWDGAEESAALAEALDGRIAEVRNRQILLATERAEQQLASLLSGPVIGLLETCEPGVWPRLYAVCGEAASTVDKELMQALAGYELERKEAEGLSQRLQQKASNNMQNHVREAALTRLSRMKDRFTDMFSLDDKKAPRMWGAGDDIPAIAQRARLAAANVLSQLAVIRAPDDQANGQGAVHRRAVGTETRNQDVLRLSNSGLDLLSAATWPGVDASRVLLQPHDVRTTWREFMSYSNVVVQQALSTQQANRLANNRLPPLWALAAMLVLGWNEAMAILFNPLYLLVVVVALLFLRSLYLELDVEREMAAGPLPGALRLSSKFLPACKSVSAQ